MTESRPDARFRPEMRLRSGDEFQRVFARRCSAANDQMILYGCENALDRTRLGLSVSRKVGSAVRRNRWKRLFREAFRLERTKLPVGLDLVFIPRVGVEPELTALRADLPRLVRQLARRLEKKRR